MHRLRLRFTCVALIAFVGAPVASAQTPSRLTRPNASSSTSDGKLQAPANATIGNLVVDLFEASGRAAAIELNDEKERKAAAAVTEIAVCSSVAGSVSKTLLSDATRAMTAESLAKLKAHDPASLADVSIGMLATLDGVSAEAIRADEALGPGAYHDAILGMTASLVACRFFGLEKSL